MRDWCFTAAVKAHTSRQLKAEREGDGGRGGVRGKEMGVKGLEV